jgi:hypothetical protein
MHLPNPCPTRWSSMDATSQGHRFCRNCDKNVFDFTQSTQEEFEAVREKEGDHLCGKFFRDEQGQIIFRAPRQKRWGQKVFLLALILSFQQTMFSNVNMDALYQWKHKIESWNQPVGNKVTFYGVAKKSGSRIKNEEVKVTVGQQFTIVSRTDKRGRFTFELNEGMQLDTLYIQVGNRKEIEFVVNETASEASKRIYHVDYKTRFVGVGCPSF